MARIFKTPFAAQGDKDTIPTPTQGDGSVSITQGFGFDYQREYEDPLAKDIRREDINGILHDITEAIGDIQLTGVTKWSADAAPYPPGAVVWHNGTAWLSLAENNSVEPVEGANWARQRPATLFVEKSANLSDLTNAAVARTNLGLGNSATLNVGTASGTVAAGNDSRITGAAQKSANLSDLTNASTARANLGLGNSATRDVGTTSGTVAAGNDSRIVGAAQASTTIAAGAGLTGGGNLSANRTLSVNFATTAQARGLTAGDVVMSPKTTGYALQPHISGSATFTRSNNQIVRTGIVPTLDLEVGDVIEITGSADNNRLHTVESITDADTIIVNYEHRNGAGSLSLVDETATVTIKRIAKWFNAPLGLGQAPVSVSHFWTRGTIYTNTSRRAIQIIGGNYSGDSQIATLYLDGIAAASTSGSDSFRNSSSVYAIVRAGGTHQVTGNSEKMNIKVYIC